MAPKVPLLIEVNKLTVPAGTTSPALELEPLPPPVEPEPPPHAVSKLKKIQIRRFSNDFMFLYSTNINFN
jgi:hypothetical protein